MTMGLKRKVKFAMNFIILLVFIKDMIVMYAASKAGMKVAVDVDGIMGLFLVCTILEKVFIEAIVFNFFEALIKTGTRMKLIFLKQAMGATYT